MYPSGALRASLRLAVVAVFVYLFASRLAIFKWASLNPHGQEHRAVVLVIKGSRRLFQVCSHRRMKLQQDLRVEQLSQ